MALRVLICASEVVPFAKTGGLADVAGALPKALAALGHDARVALPKYGSVDEGQAQPKSIGSIMMRLGEEPLTVGIEVSKAVPGVTAFLVDSPEHFQRKGLYGEPDDAQRFAVFCRGLLEFLRTSDWQPQVIHANDWQTGLIPVYLRTEYAQDRNLSRIATLYTIHNLAYQGVFDAALMEEIGLDASLLTVDRLEFYGGMNLLKGGLVFSDLLSTVSPTYSQEIQTPEYGERLEGLLQGRRKDLFGVLNGIDNEEWDPATDQLIAERFDASTAGKKSVNKEALQRRLSLPMRPDVPLFGVVSRLAGQKGFDLLGEALPHLLQLDVQVAVLGTGEQQYHDLLSRLAEQYPQKVGLVLGFDNPLAHQVYAGSDMFLMPSHYEPCGLGQMISLRYGTIPVVRRTGGLADTVTDFNAETGEGNGFIFQEATAAALLGAMVRGLLMMQNRPAWSRLVQNALACDFSWGRSAEDYVKLYELAIERHRS